MLMNTWYRQQDLPKVLWEYLEYLPNINQIFLIVLVIISNDIDTSCVSVVAVVKASFPSVGCLFTKGK